MDRHWFLTWTTYATWLPGEKRGFVGTVTDADRPTKRIDNIPGEPYLSDNEGLHRHAAAQLKCDPIFLSDEQAERVAFQFEETAEYRD